MEHDYQMAIQGIGDRAARILFDIYEKEFEKNTDRPGGDYRTLRLSQADPHLCQKLCSEDQQCLAWTYVAPGYQEAGATCWLKNVVPQHTRQDVCCTSGVAYYRRPKQ